MSAKLFSSACSARRTRLRSQNARAAFNRIFFFRFCRAVASLKSACRPTSRPDAASHDRSKKRLATCNATIPVAQASMIDSHATILNVITDARTEVFAGKHRSRAPAGRVKIHLMKMRKRKNRRIRKRQKARMARRFTSGCHFGADSMPPRDSNQHQTESGISCKRTYCEHRTKRVHCSSNTGIAPRPAIALANPDPIGATDGPDRVTSR